MRRPRGLCRRGSSVITHTVSGHGASHVVPAVSLLLAVFLRDMNSPAILAVSTGLAGWGTGACQVLPATRRKSVCMCVCVGIQVGPTCLKAQD